MMLVLVTVFLGLQYYRSRTNPQTASPNALQAAATPSASQPAAQPATATGGSAPATGPAAPAVPTVQAAAESTTTIENELYRITFTNRGGQVSSWVLKNFKGSDGQPLNLVHDQAAKLFGYPMSRRRPDPTRSLTCKGTRKLHRTAPQQEEPPPQ